MFKLVVLFAFIAVAVAKPGYLSHPSYTIAETKGYAKVGDVVQHVPTAVSHQSSSVVHSHASIVTPVVAPIVHKTIVEEHAPVVYHAPVLHKTIVSQPEYYSAPILSKTILSAPSSYGYDDHLSYAPEQWAHSAPAVKYISSPYESLDHHLW